MGLDMYLYEEKYISRMPSLAKDEPDSRWAKEGRIADHILRLADLTVEGEPGGVHVAATVMYWRKANAIHRWFVENVQAGEDDCGEYYVSRDQLIELRDLCQQVLDQVEVEHREKVPSRVILNPEVAEELLPATSGFFFGSTEYNEWYLQDLERTVEGLTAVLDNQKVSENGYRMTDFKYHSSW